MYVCVARTKEALSWEQGGRIPPEENQSFFLIATFKWHLHYH